MAETKSQQIIATIRFELPTDAVEMADAFVKVAAAWQQFSTAIKEAGLRVHEQDFTMVARNSQRPYRRRKPLEVVNG